MPQELRIVGGWRLFDFKGFRGLWSDQLILPSLGGRAGPLCNYKNTLLSSVQTFTPERSSCISPLRHDLCGSVYKIVVQEGRLLVYLSF